MFPGSHRGGVHARATSCCSSIPMARCLFLSCAMKSIGGPPEGRAATADALGAGVPAANVGPLWMETRSPDEERSRTGLNPQTQTRDRCADLVIG